MDKEGFIDDDGKVYQVNSEKKIIYYPFNKFENRTKAISQAMSNGWQVQLQIV
jgi:hypothetical protein